MHRLGPASYMQSHGPSPFGSRSISTATTPPLSVSDTRSVQNSSVPSINGDAVEGAASFGKGSGGHNELGMTEYQWAINNDGMKRG